jgi:hypothetical protein
MPDFYAAFYSTWHNRRRRTGSSPEIDDPGNALSRFAQKRALWNPTTFA